MITPTAQSQVPVITIDGPTASGKGTVAGRVAKALGWHMLDSGALYRLTALATQQQGVDSDNPQSVADVAENLDVVFSDGTILLAGQDVTDLIRHESVGSLASKIATYGPVRQSLLARQRAFRCLPGLVADGRDMGTIVFPDAPLKIFLVADALSRAKRRCKQLSQKGISANLTSLLEDMLERDKRDRDRALAPLVAAPGAVTIDSSALTIDETVNKVLGLWSGKGDPSGPV